MGISIISFCSFNLLANIGNIMFGELKKLSFKLRIKYFRWKLAKIKKIIKEKKEKADKLREE